jgi:hypothetical protein
MQKKNSLEEAMLSALALRPFLSSFVSIDLFFPAVFDALEAFLRLFLLFFWDES